MTASAVDLPGWSHGAITILGMAAVTALARGFFLFGEREPRIPEALRRALQVAPLAAIVAVLAPEIFLPHGALAWTWRDARLPAVAAATAFYVWRPGMLGTLLAGMAVYLPLRLAFGWTG